jgi:hypothetical protein
MNLVYTPFCIHDWVQIRCLVEKLPVLLPEIVEVVVVFVPNVADALEESISGLFSDIRS